MKSVAEYTKLLEQETEKIIVGIAITSVIIANAFMATLRYKFAAELAKILA